MSPRTGVPRVFTLLAASLLILSATVAEADWLGPGCWFCDSIGLTGIEGRCKKAGEGEHGDGTDCSDKVDPLGLRYCDFRGNPCTNTTVSGGGGGGGTGGSGSNPCVVLMAQSCPAECMSCERYFF